MRETFVIVGAGLTGGSAVVALREEGFGGELVLIGAEPEVPYERPPLSKEYLRGEATFEDTLVRPPNFYADKGIETRLGIRATKVDLEGKVVELEGGNRVPYDKILIATGGRNRRPPIPGLDLEGVYDLRTVSDADRIRSHVAPGRKVVIAGMGFIGSEVAASLRMLGMEVSIIARSRLPLVRVLGEEIASVMESIHRDQGVEMVFEDAVEAFEGSGRVERVRTQDGRVIACDFVVVGLGIEPITEVVVGSAVRIENGIVVDEHCRTSVEGVYAAGDVANHYHPVFDRRIRVEHWQHAIKHGQAAARSMLGSQKPYDEVYWFWSDQYNYNLQYAGFASDWDELIVRGSLEKRKFVAFYLKGGRILATVGMNRGKDVHQSMGLIKAGIQVDLARLRDEAIQVRDLALG
jgi:3-phenylpropionate/trans-cinnamate dioxygenase ferredoxin reductase subunit